MTHGPTGSESDRDVLLDVSRLIWRGWEKRLPTGIDRVCLAYLEHFRARARAVVQRKRWRVALSAKASDQLFELILNGETATRLDWIRLALKFLREGLRSTPIHGAIYLNVGHTGLDEASLPAWIASNHLCAIYMIHDLIPLTHPQFCRDGEAAKHLRRLDGMLASASGIIGNSKATLAELEQFAASQQRRLPPTVAALIAGHQPSTSASPVRLRRPYFIVLGTIEARKNHMLLVQVWRRLVADLRDAAPVLVIAGQRGWEAESTLAILDDLAELQGHVVELNRCDDDELAGWVAGAHGLLMPSFVEGFGLPVIEAIQLSTPVIASDLPVYREIAGEIPTYLDPQDLDGWIKAIQDFAADGSERQRQMSAMKSYHAPTWSTHFQRVEAWLYRIGGRGPFPCI